MTMFVPVDQAFFHLSQSGYNRYHKLAIRERYTLVAAHIFPAYYTLTALQSSKIFMQPTLATLDMGSETFSLNISGINDSVFIDTGIIRGVITRTVYDHVPIAIYAVSKVLLPPELFGKNYHNAPSPYRAPFSGFDDGSPPPPPVSSAVVPLPMFMVTSSYAAAYV
ncbi:hypothetical protein TSUD_403760 [Trifolium subterraneum]|uniref:FAS1 domain-containing protein n=1 Tax=Trifolium subterraneum TaxID=3900 RepID=A0A2Z6NYV6_TRISU|nr:hypothetical protein TSUD_403760 [Trifolium subterraneum]